MKTLDMEGAVIADLKKTALTLMTVLDKDTEKALVGNDPAVIASINVNLRTLAAINEVLMYYGDGGVFAE